MKDKTKRLLTDAAGYFLILLGAATGWLPGPGGIPLVLAGLGLLSIHNLWARRIRDWLLDHAGEFARIFFPQNRWIQLLYDFLVAALLAVVSILVWHRAAVWQIGLATGLFFLALLIAGLNRDRVARIKGKFGKA